MKKEIFRMEHISLQVNTLHILWSVSFRLFEGESSVLIGSPREIYHLCQIISGEIPADSGTLYIDDVAIATDSNMNINHAGIYVISSQSHMFSSMTIARNFDLFQNPKHPGFIHDTALCRKTNTLLEAFGLSHIKASTRLDMLTNSERLILTIIFYIAAGARLLIFDTLNWEKNNLQLNRILQLIHQRGISVLFLANIYDQIYEKFDQMIILNHGVATGILSSSEINYTNFLTNLSPKSLTHNSFSGSNEIGDILLSVHNVSPMNSHMPQLSFNLMNGESLGICGMNVEAASMLSTVLSGHEKYCGNIILDGQPLEQLTIRDSIRSGIAMISSLPPADNIYPYMDLYQNITILANQYICNRFRIIKKHMQKYITRYVLQQLHAEDLFTAYGHKSNLQDLSEIDQLRVLIAKWLCIHPKLFIFVNPFTFLDETTIHIFVSIIQILCSMQISVLILSMNREWLDTTCKRVITLPCL